MRNDIIFLILPMIDINASVGNWAFRPLPSSSISLFAKKIKAEGIDKALVSPIEGIFYDEPQLANESLFKLINSFPSLIPIAVLNPRLPNWEKSLNICYEKYGIKAIKLYPNYHGYNAKDDYAKDLLKCAGKMNLGTIIQLRVQDVRAQNPLYNIPDVNVNEIISLASELSGTRFMLGGIKWQEANSISEQIGELPNVWLDISNIEYVDVLRKLMRIYNIDRLLFGTHTPFFVIKSAILKLREARLTDSEYRIITENNAINAFNL